LARLNTRLIQVMAWGVLIAGLEWALRHRPVGEIASYSRDAISVTRTKAIPRSASVLMDDEITFGVHVEDPERFRKVTALQFFNILPDATRQRILAATDYVIAEKGDRVYSYLQYDPQRRGMKDPFRRCVTQLERDPTSRCAVYGNVLASGPDVDGVLSVSVIHPASADKTE